MIYHSFQPSSSSVSTEPFGLRYEFDNTKDGFYIAPSFMDKLVVHITKNFMALPNIKVIPSYLTSCGRCH